MRLLSIFFPLLFMLSSLFAQKDTGYQLPPQALQDLVNAPQTPSVYTNSTGDWLVLMQRPGFISIEELAQPELRLAGLRINPRTNGASRSTTYVGLTFRSVLSDTEKMVEGLPEDALIQNVRWSPDGQNLAFTIQKVAGIELWVADVKTGSAHKLTEPIINDALYGTPYVWLPDSKKLIYKSVLADRGPAPEQPLAPNGPIIQEANGTEAPVRTYQDLLQNAHDEALFMYYSTSQLHLVQVDNKHSTAYGEPGIYDDFYPSPDGQYVFTSSIQQPFSYIVPMYRFPLKAAVRDLDGNIIQTIADLPLADNIPKGFDATTVGPRGFQWREDHPSTLVWVEAQDGGDPARESEIRDQIFYLPAPFTGEKIAGITTSLRFRGIDWGNDELAIVREYSRKTRKMLTSTFVPGDPASKTVLFDLSSEDRYGNPGYFATHTNEFGREVLLMDKSGKKLYLEGTGASPEGNRPFVREFSLKTRKSKELWRSQAPYYENSIQLLDIKKGLILTRRESPTEPPNYFLRDLKKGTLTALTQIAHPYKELKGIQKQVVTYQRKDGLELSGNLYLPEGYTAEDGPLPTFMWAYPREFKSAKAASQRQGSPYSFVRLSWGSAVPFVTQGYAVFDGFSMPIIGEGDAEPNDGFREQLVMNAEAAVNKLADMGVTDRNRVAVGGHSYGAFMTANLLAHSNLFAAGIARSGAYNRTLTPFGFQAEPRTYWEAPEIYYNMSPFMHADKINEPLLMTHGEADNNSGTFPIQSKRLFAAIKGMGGTARLVMLPHESHGYRAKESILHMFWEMNRFLDTHVKNRTLASESEQKVGEGEK
ncbi:MAG: prolyl oligopeptidase family serine peptidase [Bacteroidota bacterium]